MPFVPDTGYDSRVSWSFPSSEISTSSLSSQQDYLSVEETVSQQEYKLLTDHELVPKQIFISLPHREPDDRRIVQNPPILMWQNSENSLLVFQEEKNAVIATINRTGPEIDFFITGPLLVGQLENNNQIISSITSNLSQSVSYSDDPLLTLLLLLLGKHSVAYRFTSEQEGDVYAFIDADGRHHLIPREQLIRIIGLYSDKVIVELYPEVFGEGLRATNSDTPEAWNQMMRIIPPGTLRLLDRLINEYDIDHTIVLLEQLTHYVKETPVEHSKSEKKRKKKSGEPPKVSTQSKQAEASAVDEVPGRAYASGNKGWRLRDSRGIHESSNKSTLLKYEESLTRLMGIIDLFERFTWSRAHSTYDTIYVMVSYSLFQLKSVYNQLSSKIHQEKLREVLHRPSGVQPDDLLTAIASPVFEATYQLFSSYYQTLLNAQKAMAEGKPGCIPTPFYFFETLKAVLKLDLLCLNPKYQSLFVKSDFRPVLAAVCGLMMTLTSQTAPSVVLKISSQNIQGRVETKMAEYIARAFPPLRPSEPALVKTIVGILSLGYWQHFILNTSAFSLEPQYRLNAVESLLISIETCIQEQYFQDASTALDYLTKCGSLGQDLSVLVHSNPALADTCNRVFLGCIGIVLKLAPEYRDKPHQQAMSLFEDFIETVDYLLLSFRNPPEAEAEAETEAEAEAEAAAFAHCTEQLYIAKRLIKDIFDSDREVADRTADELVREDFEQIEQKRIDRRRLDIVLKLTSQSFQTTVVDQTAVAEQTASKEVKKNDIPEPSSLSKWEDEMLLVHQSYQSDNLQEALDHLHIAISSTTDNALLVKSYCEQILMEGQQLRTPMSQLRVLKRKLNEVEEQVKHVNIQVVREIMADISPESPIKAKLVKLREHKITPTPLYEQKKYYQNVETFFAEINKSIIPLNELMTSVECLVLQFDPMPQDASAEMVLYVKDMLTLIETDLQWLSSHIISIKRTLITIGICEQELGQYINSHIRIRQRLLENSSQLYKDIDLKLKGWQALRGKLAQ